MRKLLVLLLILVSVIAEGRKISESEAAAIASEFLNSATVKHPSSKAGVRRVKARDAVNADAAPFYVYNADGNNGFVIVSGDDRATRILGYSDTGSFDYDNLPPQLDDLLKQYAEQLKNIPEATPTHDSWKAPAQTSEEEGVLLETANWGQGAPYNSLCPIVDGVQAPTGCVATAMAIVMKYHKWPENYDWTAMPIENVDVSNSSEIAKLMADIGIAVDMSYGSQASSAIDESARYAFTEDFMYSNAIQFIKPKYFDYELLSPSQQIAAIKTQIDKNYPCLMSGENEGTAHMFVCDGYKGDLVHINWGWDGISNGYFDIAPTGNMIYQNEQSLIIEINHAPNDYSKVFIDSSTNYDRSMGVGLNVRNKEIKPGEPIEFVLASFGAPLDYEGKVTIALVNKEGKIKELINEPVEPWYTINQSERDRLHIDKKYHRFYWDSRWHKFTFRGPIESEDKLCVVAQESGTDAWQIVPCTITTSNSCNVSANIPKTVTIDYEIPDGANVSSVPPISEDHTFLVGQKVDFHVNSKVGFPELDMESYQTPFICSDMGYVEYKGEYYVNAQFSVFGTQKIDIGISLARFDELLTKEIVLSQYNTLAENIPVADLLRLGYLTIKGKLSSSDYNWLVTNARNLRSLDIKDTDLVAISTAPKWLTNFNLPSGLKSISSYTFRGKGSLLGSIVLPTSLKSIDAHAFFQAGGILSNIISLNPIPPAINKDAFSELCNLYSSNTYHPILIVPVGSKELYSESPGWKDFSLICESSLIDTSFKNVSENGYEYDIIADIARIKNLPWNLERLTLPETFIFEGRKYAVTTVEVRLEKTPLYDIQRKIKYLKVPGNIRAIGWSCFDYCHDLQIVDIAEGVEQIEFNAFAGCMNLKKISMPSSISHIGDGCFRSSFSTTDIYYNTKEPINANKDIFFDETYKNATLHIPVGATSNFRKMMPWSEFVNIVEEVIPKSIALPNNEPTITVGESINLVVEINPVDATNKDVTWESSDTEIAEVDENGAVTGIRAGVAIIVATTCNGLSASCEITVLPANILVSSISLNPSSVAGKEGERVQINAIVLPEDATNKAINWSSSDESVATVDESGMISLLKKGTAVVTASATDDSGVSADCAIVVSEASGIEDVLTDKSAFVKIFNMKGVLVFEGKYADARLVPDYYIVVCDGRNIKVKVK